MIKSKYLKVVTCILITCALIFSTILVVFPKATTVTSLSTNNTSPYSSTLFNKSSVSKIDISLSDSDWQSLLANPLDEIYYKCDITINGKKICNVGIRAKGNTSLSQVASSDSDRFSFKVEFDKYVTGQTYNGLDKLNLNNIYADATYLKEYIAYDLFDFMGVNTPENSFSNITINDNNWGLYLAIEGLENSYLTRNYGEDSGNLYKAEGTGTNLVYNGETQSNYSGLKNNSVKDITDEDFQKVVDMIKNLNEGTNLEDYINVEATLKYFAVSTALVNLDSYQSNLYHNYYIYEKDGVCTILPWDLNLSFGAFSGGGGGNHQMNQKLGNTNDTKNTDNTNTTNNKVTMNKIGGGMGSSDATSIITFPIDEPTSSTMEQSPLLSKLLENDKYKDLYHSYLQTIVNDYFNSNVFKTKLYAASTLIDEYVKNDPTSFYGYDQFSKAVDSLYDLGTYRADGIQEQLSGEIPTTKDEQSAVDLTTYFSSDLVDMQLLGTMGGGNGGGKQMITDRQATTDGRQMPTDEQSPDGGGQMPADGQSPLDGGQMPTDGQTPPDGRQIPTDGQSPNYGRQMPADGQSPDGGRQMPADGQTPPGGGQKQDGNASKKESDTSKKLSTQSIIKIIISLGAIILALIFTIFFNKRKFKP
jgi:spore coat protein CotH